MAAGKHEMPKGEKEKVKKKKRGRKRLVGLRLAIPAAIILLVFCIFMISPLRGCVLSDEAYIGSSAALELAIADSGILADRAQDKSCKMVVIDDRVCYKIAFSGSVSEYRYIIDAETGEIVRAAETEINK